ncbi:MAG: hypothetical protein ALAOOOJD_01476 [bacterium]|nr:hypothetical protein [bacterium]
MFNPRLVKKNLLCGLLILVAGCAGSRVKIGELITNPDKYNEKYVTVKGKVTQTYSIPILSIGIAKIDDGSGAVWVKPAGRTFFEGQKVAVSGTHKIGLTLGSQSFGNIIIEGEKK